MLVSPRAARLAPRWFLIIFGFFPAQDLKELSPTAPTEDAISVFTQPRTGSDFRIAVSEDSGCVTIILASLFTDNSVPGKHTFHISVGNDVVTVSALPRLLFREYLCEFIPLTSRG